MRKPREKFEQDPEKARAIRLEAERIELEKPDQGRIAGQIRNEKNWRTLQRMKRTPLKRKTPMKRGCPRLKKTKLKGMSDRKKEFESAYRYAKFAAPSYVRTADKPFALERKDYCDPHHPFGRVGDKILAFLWITKSKHEDIHDRGKKARADGWLHPPFWGMSLDPSWPRPWPEWAEEKWPEKYKRTKKP